MDAEKRKIYHFPGDTKPIILNKSVATCPECKEQEWVINLNGFRMSFEEILSFECACCGFEIALESE